jgi:hypothetical protein
MGPALQAPWVLSFLLSLYLYLRKVVCLGGWESSLICSVFILNTGTFFFNRGWPDFGMDFMSYVVLGNGLIFYLWKRKQNHTSLIVLAGLFLGFSCLWRSINIVYVTIMLLPVELYDCLKAQNKKEYVRQFFVLLISFLGTCGWFYFYDWDSLYYYYFVWNKDARAMLPLTVSWRHFVNLLYGRIGVSALIVCAGFGLGRWIENLYRGDKFGWSKVNWLYLWMGIVPVGFLCLKGAGLNPFVVFPSLFGILLFFLTFYKTPCPLRPGILWISTLCILALTADTLYCSYLKCLRGVPESPKIEIESALGDLEQVAAKVKAGNSVQWAVVCDSQLSGQAISCALVYEKGAVYIPGGLLHQSGKYVNKIVRPEYMERDLADADTVFVLEQADLNPRSPRYGEYLECLRVSRLAVRALSKLPHVAIGRKLIFSDKESCREVYQCYWIPRALSYDSTARIPER